MVNRITLFRAAAAVGLSLAICAPVAAQELHNEGPAPTTAIIAVQSKSAPLDPADLKLSVDGHPAVITSVQPVPPAAAQVAILIDDGVRASFNNQIKEIADFINALPQGTKVLLGYMENGTVRSSGHFSPDHQEIASQLRVAISAPGISASPYFCLSDFVKHWPSQEPGPRFVLMLTNGVDPYNGSVSPMNQDSPYVQTAANDAQRAGVAVYSIYYPDSRERGFAVSVSGQSYLEQVADATGGESFYNGNITPVSLAPYLLQFAEALGHSYELRFTANAGRGQRDGLVRIKLRSTQHGVKLRVPDAVHAGNAAS